MTEYQYHPEPEFTPVKPEPTNDSAALHCIAMARDAIARSPLKSDWTQDAFNWLDGAVAILTKGGDA